MSPLQRTLELKDDPLDHDMMEAASIPAPSLTAVPAASMSGETQSMERVVKFRMILADLDYKIAAYHARNV